MPTELEELVEFLHHGNTQIRQVAADTLVPFSQSQQSLFKRNQLEPIKDLKLLVKDYDPIKQNALTMLINLSGDEEIRENLAKDDAFLETLLLHIINPKDRFGNELSMLLANLSKSDSLVRLFDLQRAVAPDLSGSANAMDQLMDVFVRTGSDSAASGTTTTSTSWNKAKLPADAEPVTYDFLAYVFADLAKHERGQTYLTTPQKQPRPPKNHQRQQQQQQTATSDGGDDDDDDDDGETVFPLGKLLPFTAAGMPLPRRLGVAGAVKNASFAVGAHAALVGSAELRLLTYLLLPLASGRDGYDDEEQERLLDDLQLLDDDVVREPDARVLRTHVETLLVLSSSKPGRQALRDAGAYYVVRECHKAVQDDDVQMACERLVQMLQRGEPGEEEEGENATADDADGKSAGKILGEAQDDSDDDKIVDVV